MSRVGVIGAGYVGLTTAACLAHLGHDVVCGDIDVEKLSRLSEGEIPILEDGLAEMVADGLDAGRLSFVLGAAAAAAGQEFVILCLPTPQGAEASVDLSYIERAVREMAAVLEPGAVVVSKSTMPPGSSDFVRRVLDSTCEHPSSAVVAANPEFLRQGTAVHDFLNPDRIVIGADEPDVAARVSSLYAGIQAPLVITDNTSAEMIKYASNAFLATKISFANAVANLCEALGGDIEAVTLGMGYDRRIGFGCLSAGPGYGGSCLPKDVAALIRAAEVVGSDFNLLRVVTEVNEAQRLRVLNKIRSLSGGVDGVRVAVWGLSFKANTDDLRGSPAVEIVRRLLAEGALVTAFDPAAGRDAASFLARTETVIPDLEIVMAGEGSTNSGARSRDAYSPALDRFFVASDPYEACRGALVLAVLTDWEEFRWLDFGRVAALMRTPAVIDARNLLDPVALHRLGFTYRAVGR